MAETVEEIVNLKLENIKKEGVPGAEDTSRHHVFAIVESDSPDCILKKVPQLKGVLTLQVTHHRDGWRVFKSTDYSIRHDRWGHKNGVQRISLESKHQPQINLVKRTHAWSSQEVEVLFGEGFSTRFTLQDCNLVINDNSSHISLEFGNASFPLEKFLSHADGYKVVDFASLFRFIDRLPINRREVYEDRAKLDKMAKYFSITKPAPIEGKLEGITKTFAKVKEWYLADTDLARAFSFRCLASNSKYTVKSVKISVIFNKLFEKVETAEDFYKVCDQINEQHFKNRGDGAYFYTRLDYGSLVESLMDTLEDGREIQKAAIKRKSTGAFNKIMNDLDFISINKETHPLTHEAVHSGDIPLGTFFRKNGESYFVYNDNWDLWEAMLKDHREVALDIAKSCSGRTTYEKDIMSYFYFTLHELPEYLESNTGKKWKGIPKLVNSADELEPPKEGENGIAKTRSALTPIVDNEKNEVVVPYVSMRIGGYQTTYCYGLTYSVLKRGFSYMGNTVTKDVEKQLNGRDDYGLMFYTLTGSSQGRGYPTFLIIFEDLTKPYESPRNIKVHFHRTHPMRSKGGDYNPIHNWTQGCYKWMIGNVNFERIKAQQGDLAFVEIDKFPEGEAEKVNGYDSHMFETPVDYLPYIKKDKQNVLGYIKLDNPTTLNHTEHMTRKLPAGVYEIRQCRSWEANPKGIWSLRID